MDRAGNRAGGVAPPLRDADRAQQEPSSVAPSRLYSGYVKPAFDRVGGLLLLILSLPLILVSAVVVLLKLGRPVFFRQTRVGRNGEEFDLWKLRTMIPDRRRGDHAYEGPDRREVHKSPNDPRVPPAGRVLRKWRLDELPQFWNVVTGDMSLVGPRPEMPEIVATYEEWQHQRHNVKPGLTGPWQVSARNGALMHECTDLDLEYVDRVTFVHDVTLLAKTPAAIVGNRRGY